MHGARNRVRVVHAVRKGASNVIVVAPKPFLDQSTFVDSTVNPKGVQSWRIAHPNTTQGYRDFPVLLVTYSGLGEFALVAGSLQSPLLCGFVKVRWRPPRIANVVVA
jgi:hypothetical protein